MGTAITMAGPEKSLEEAPRGLEVLEDLERGSATQTGLWPKRNVRSGGRAGGAIPAPSGGREPQAASADTRESLTPLPQLQLHAHSPVLSIRGSG